MNPQERGGGTDESEQTAQPQQQESPSLSDEIVAMLSGTAPQKPKTPAKEEPKPEEPKPEEEEKEPEKPEEIPKPETEEDQEEEEPIAADAKVWPASARKRVSEETDKKRRAMEERDQWKAQATELAQRLQQATLPKPTRANPLADVYDMAGLQEKKDQYKALRNMATTALDENPNVHGEERIEVSFGTDPKTGQPLIREFKREELREMQRTADDVINEAIPLRQKYLVERNAADAMAAQFFPQFTENGGDNPWFKAGQQILHDYPVLEQNSSCWFDVGCYLLGRAWAEGRAAELMKKTAKSEIPEKADVLEKIRNAPKVKKPPEVSAARIPTRTPSGGADVEAARRKMEESGTDEAMSDFIGAKLFGGASRGVQRVS